MTINRAQFMMELLGGKYTHIRTTLLQQHSPYISFSEDTTRNDIQGEMFSVYSGVFQT